MNVAQTREAEMNYYLSSEVRGVKTPRMFAVGESLTSSPYYALRWRMVQFQELTTVSIVSDTYEDLHRPHRYAGSDRAVLHEGVA